jgi:cell wall-associated protease
MSFTHSSRALALILVATAAFTQAHAASLPEIEAMLPQSLESFKQLTASDLHHLLDVRDAKGNSIYHHTITRAQAEQIGEWSQLDPVNDKVQGTSTQKIYDQLKVSPTDNEVIVAVIDSGVDINHEDLQGHIWTNPNLAQDAKAGFPGALHGWNFLGNKSDLNKNVGGTTLELTRELAKMQAKKASGTLTDANQKYLDALQSEYDEKLAGTTKELKDLKDIDNFRVALESDGLPKHANLATLMAFQPKATGSISVESLTAARDEFVAIFENDPDQIRSTDDLVDALNETQTSFDYNYDLTANSSDIIGDDPNDIEVITPKNAAKTAYGNANVIGPNPFHGTHVSGIIAALRNNNLGVNGQALNVKIMPIRAVPDGDERDKDIGNAIRFAVDHGAKIINMSFGKEYSPNKDYVDQAMLYAAQHNVLLVHAGGNDGKNTENATNNFPNKIVKATREAISTWIEIGASNQTNDETLIASFSNYGKTSVDVFAPGVNILSCVPGKDDNGNTIENKYAFEEGTSMASPEVAGVAALLLELYPNATANQLKRAILASTNQYPGLNVNITGPADALGNATTKSVLFSSLSATGGTVNAFAAATWLSQNQK